MVIRKKRFRRSSWVMYQTRGALLPSLAEVLVQVPAVRLSRSWRAYTAARSLLSVDTVSTAGLDSEQLRCGAGMTRVLNAQSSLGYEAKSSRFGESA